MKRECNRTDGLRRMGKRKGDFSQNPYSERDAEKGFILKQRHRKKRI